jgi:hypothetical protein
LRTITTPLVVITSPLWPNNTIIKSGLITQTTGSDVITFAYAKVAFINKNGKVTGYKTQVTITKDGETKVINRMFGKKLVKWW